jgi:peptide chain release factor subunit 1
LGKLGCLPIHSQKRCRRYVDVTIKKYLSDLLSPEEIIVHVNKEQEKDREKFTDKSTGAEMELAAEPQSLLEWFAEKYKEFGANS